MFTQNFLLVILTIIISLTVHEAAHALAAYKLGDSTAKNEGRLTLNPLKHLDPWGSILFLFTSFGWGKPVPVNPIYFKNPKRDQALVALAGPISNIIMAFIGGMLLTYIPEIQVFAYIFMQINIVLALFNLLPFPPLDGSKIIGVILSDNQFIKYQNFIHNYSAYVIIILFLDLYLLPKIINFSIIGSFISSLTAIIQALLLAGL
jgi:Zn-dependent protease